MIQDFGDFLLFALGGVGFVIISLTVARFIRADRPNEEKLTTYECGEEPVGSAWGQFNIRFYVVALIFLLFEVEILYLFPWGVIFGDKELIEGTDWAWARFALVEMFIFIIVLALGLVYAWRKGFLDWVKPVQKLREFNSEIPAEAYKHLKD